MKLSCLIQKGVQGLSGRVLDLGSPEPLCCVLEQDTLFSP